MDVTSGFGKKWKLFFQHLELHYAFNLDNEFHLWLLHFLFLERINGDAQAFIASWNFHTLSSRTQAYRTPTDMYRQGMLQHGFRGVFDPTIGETDPSTGEADESAAYAVYGCVFCAIHALTCTYTSYVGVDWDAIDTNRFRNHHREHNPADISSSSIDNIFDADTPEEMSHVEVPVINCPLNAQGVMGLHHYIQQLPCFHGLDQPSLIQLWVQASNYIRSLPPPQ